jgi:hypothetical protein
MPLVCKPGLTDFFQWGVRLPLARLPISIALQVAFVDTENPLTRMTVFVKDAGTVLDT